MVTPVCRDQHQPPLHCVYLSHPGEAHHKPPLQVLDPPMVRQPLTQGEKAKPPLTGQVFLEGFGFVNCLCRITLFQSLSCQKLIQIPAAFAGCLMGTLYFMLVRSCREKKDSCRIFFLLVILRIVESSAGGGVTL